MEACYHGNSPLILVGQVDLRNNKMLQALINIRGTQREYSSKPLKHGIVKRILVVKR